MKYFYIVLISLFLLQSSYADSIDIKLKYDKVSIGYIPSRGAIIKGEPHVIIEAKTLTQHKNKKIDNFFIALNNVASEGITDNATRFHQPTNYIEAIFQGKRVRLFFVGDSNLDKFSHYEKQWKLLHNEIYEYLNKEISPNESLNRIGAKDAPPS